RRTRFRPRHRRADGASGRGPDEGPRRAAAAGCPACRGRYQARHAKRIPRASARPSRRSLVSTRVVTQVNAASAFVDPIECEYSKHPRGIVKTLVVCFDSAMSPPSTRPPLYKGYRFPPQIISHGVWLYYRFAVSLRDVSELLLARGIEVSHEAVRLWTVRFGLEYARRLRRTRGPCSNVWHLDELCLMINGKRGWLW